MGDVKPVIAFLCKHLKLLYSIELKAEHFRLAKFNKTENNCVSKMWTLLQKLCHEIHQPWLNIENPILYVKLHFMTLGYNSIEFYCLPMDKSSGSRELLLAFGWMLLTQDLLEKSIMKEVKMSPLNMEFDPKILQNGEMESSKPTKEYLYSKVSLENKLNFILWCAGKIRYNIKTIQELGDTRIKSAHMVHESTIKTCGLPHLSVLETHLVKCPERVPEFLASIKKCCEVTDSHQLWVKKMHIFWEWMESVVVEKKANCGLSGFHLGGNNQKVLSQLLAAARSHMKHYLLYCNKENGKTVRPCALQNNYMSCDMNSRFIYSSKDTKSEISDMLSDSKLQLEELEKTCLIKKEKLLSKLQQAQEQMKNILVVSSEF